MANDHYIERLKGWANSGRENIASPKILQSADYIDFDTIATVLDIGSWHLKQSIEFAYAFPTATIHAFEPSPQNLRECIQMKSGVPKDVQDRIQVYNVALSNKNGPLIFYDIDTSQGVGYNPGAASKYKFVDGMNGTFFNQNWIQKEITVEALTLDHWAMTNGIKSVDALWVDVQGGELDVFKGGSQTLKNVKVIFTEVGLKEYYKGQSLKPEIEEFLFKLGFEELPGGFEINGFEYEGNNIYIRK